MSVDRSHEDVTPLPKITRPWVCMKNNPTCARVDPCPACRGRRNRREGLRKQREAKRLAGVPDGRFRATDGNEEGWRDERLRWEVKSGVQVSAMWTRFLQAETQADRNKAIGDPRPFAFIAMPKGIGKEGLVVMRATTFRDLFS